MAAVPQIQLSVVQQILDKPPEWSNHCDSLMVSQPTVRSLPPKLRAIS